MKLEKGFLLGFIGLLMILSAILVLPYIQFILGAIVLAFILRPLQRRLEPRIGGTIAAVSLVIGSVFTIILPFVLIFAFIASAVVGYFRALEEHEFDFATLEEPIASYTGQEVDLESFVRSSGEGIGEWVFGGAIAAAETAVHLLIGFGLLLFLLFFFVRDADRFVAWFRDVSPMDTSVTDELLERMSNITRAVLIGHVLVAIIQGAIAGIGLAVVGIPNALVWTFIMMLLALIPLIGTFVVWAPASAYLLYMGSTVSGIALFVYGAFVVGISDEYLRPVLVNRYATIGPSVIILGVIGGISVFGFMGLFFGPIIVGLLKETIEVYDDYYGQADG